MKLSPRALAGMGLLILMGSALYALAFDWFFAPNQLAMGGVTGLAQIVHRLLPALPTGVAVILFNVPIFLAGWRFLGGWLLLSSLASMAASSLLIDLLSVCVPFSPMADRLLSAVAGGAVMGLGLGLVFRQGATTGGSDIVSRLIQRKLSWFPMGKVVLMVDLTVILLVSAVFRSVESALYGVVALYVSTLMMDWVLYGLDTAKVAYIISDAPDDIARSVIDGLGRSVTFLKGQGGYTGAEKKVILCAFKQREIVELKEAVRRADPNAFLIVTNAHEVLGEGFQPDRPAP